MPEVKIIIVRYADDIVMGFEHEGEARRNKKEYSSAAGTDRGVGTSLTMFGLGAASKAYLDLHPATTSGNVGNAVGNRPVKRPEISGNHKRFADRYCRTQREGSAVEPTVAVDPATDHGGSRDLQDCIECPGKFGLPESNGSGTFGKRYRSGKGVWCIDDPNASTNPMGIAGSGDPNTSGAWNLGDRNNPIASTSANGVAIPESVQIDKYGSVQAAFGKPVTVTNPATGLTTVAPIVDVGPENKALDMLYGTARAIGATVNSTTPVIATLADGSVN